MTATLLSLPAGYLTKLHVVMPFRRFVFSGCLARQHLNHLQ